MLCYSCSYNNFPMVLFPKENMIEYILCIMSMMILSILLKHPVLWANAHYWRVISSSYYVYSGSLIYDTLKINSLWIHMNQCICSWVVYRCTDRVGKISLLFSKFLVRISDTIHLLFYIAPIEHKHSISFFCELKFKNTLFESIYLIELVVG